LSESVDTPSSPRSATWTGRERRRRSDRRSGPTSGLAAWLGLGPRRRRSGRRTGETENTYVDLYSRRDLMLLMGVFVLNVFDAFFTLRWLQMGGGEGNPIMHAALERGPRVFLFQKCLVVGLWLVLLIAHKNFRIARHGLWMLLGFYGAVFVYHFVLQAGGFAPRS